MIRHWNLAETNYEFTKSNSYEVAVLPLGATEPHNLHLPYGTDVFEATILGEKICEKADQLGAKVALLPTIPFGTQTNMRKLPLAINVNPSTLFAFITDIINSLGESGIRKVLLLNSHGGNEFKPLLRELAGQPVQLFLCNWFRSLDDVYDEIFDHPEDHAGEMETSFAMAYFNQFVNYGADGKIVADEGATRPTRFDAVNQGWVSITRRWDHLTTNCGSGNPHLSSAEKGKKCVELLVERLSQFLLELSQSELDDHFPFE